MKIRYDAKKYFCLCIAGATPQVLPGGYTTHIRDQTWPTEMKSQHIWRICMTRLLSSTCIQIRHQCRSPSRCESLTGRGIVKVTDWWLRDDSTRRKPICVQRWEPTSHEQRGIFYARLGRVRRWERPDNKKHVFLPSYGANRNKWNRIPHWLQRPLSSIIEDKRLSTKMWYRYRSESAFFMRSLMHHLMDTQVSGAWTTECKKHFSCHTWRITFITR